MFQIPKTLPEALRMAAELAEQIEKDRPKVLFADKCLKSNESILIRELAKIACENGFEIGEKGLFKRLREWGLLMSNNEPYQRFMRYFEVVERPYPTYSGAKLSRTTKVLPRGQAYILNRLEKERQAS
jgi:phage antirepressor YoqD-like protein